MQERMEMCAAGVCTQFEYANEAKKKRRRKWNLHDNCICCSCTTAFIGAHANSQGTAAVLSQVPVLSQQTLRADSFHLTRKVLFSST